MNTIYSEILGIAPDADSDAIKQAYRKLARANHPDHFPAEERPLQELRMMQINEAYEFLSQSAQAMHRNPSGDAGQTDRNTTPHSAGGQMQPGPASLSRDMGSLRDPAYAYYKQGFNEYSRGVGGMMLRGKRKITPDASGLKNTVKALQHFQAAYRYFQRVVQEHPDSIWVSDARYKLYRLERFQVVYKRIQQNLKNIHKEVQPTAADGSAQTGANRSANQEQGSPDEGSTNSAQTSPSVAIENLQNLADAMEKEFGSSD